MQPFRKLAFVINQQKAGANDLADELIGRARAAGIKKIKTAAAQKLPRGYFKGSDACCVIGGDGTLLGAVREATLAGVPIIGVNQGSLGYLTTFSPDEARTHFVDLINGAYRIAWRSLLDCKTGPRRRDIALNDVLIKNEVNSRLVRLEVHADNELVTDYNCDGVIFATPTGSTAYNLATGGPIIHPAARVIAMTPICPHTLSNRSIIFQDGVRLRIYNQTADTRVLVAMDGQRNLVMTEGTPIEVSISRRRLALVQRRDYSHFGVMRTKLKWSGGLADKK